MALGLLGSRRDERVVLPEPRSRRRTVAGRRPPSPSGARWRRAAPAHPPGARRRDQSALGLRARVARATLSAALDETTPRSAMAASMSTRRLEKARRIVFGMSESSPRPFRPTCQRRPRGASSARSADW